MMPQASGEESWPAAVAAQPVEAKPSIGQIKPSQEAAWSRLVVKENT